MRKLEISMLNQQMHTDLIYAIAESEQRYTQQLTRIALDILKHRKEKPILLLSGPSGSGYLFFPVFRKVGIQMISRVSALTLKLLTKASILGLCFRNRSYLG